MSLGPACDLRAVLRASRSLLARVEAWAGGDACFACEQTQDEGGACVNPSCDIVVLRHRFDKIASYSPKGDL